MGIKTHNGENPLSQQFGWISNFNQLLKVMELQLAANHLPGTSFMRFIFSYFSRDILLSINRKIEMTSAQKRQKTYQTDRLIFMATNGHREVSTYSDCFRKYSYPLLAGNNDCIPLVVKRFF